MNLSNYLLHESVDAGGAWGWAQCSHFVTRTQVTFGACTPSFAQPRHQLSMARLKDVLRVSLSTESGQGNTQQCLPPTAH